MAGERCAGVRAKGGPSSENDGPGPASFTADTAQMLISGKHQTEFCDSERLAILLKFDAHQVLSDHRCL